MLLRKTILCWVLPVMIMLLLSGVSLVSTVRAQTPICTTPINISNTPGNDHTIKLEDNFVVWSSHDGNDEEIYLYNLNAAEPVATNISNRDGFDDVDPEIKNGVVIWSGYDGNDFEIFMFNANSELSQPVNISNRDGFDDHMPQIDYAFKRPRVVWHGWDGNDYEIFLYDMNLSVPTVTNVSNRDGFDDTMPIIQFTGKGATLSKRILWNGWDGNDYDIYMDWIDNATMHYTGKLTDTDDQNEQVVQVFVSTVLWTSSDATNDGEINISSLGNISNRSSLNDFDPQFDEWTNRSLVVWSGDDGNDNEIYLYSFHYDGQPVETLTNISNRDSLEDKTPKIDDRLVVWVGDDSNDFEIYLYDPLANMSLPINISNRDGFNDEGVEFEDGVVAWIGDISDGTTEVFMALCGNLINENFRDKHAFNKFWTYGGVRSREKIRCSFNGCHFLFRGSPTENASINRTVNSKLVKSLQSGDKVNLEVYLQTLGGAILRVRVVVVYEDQTRDKIIVLFTESRKVIQLTRSLELKQALRKIRVSLINRTQKEYHKIYFHHLRLFATESEAAALDTLELPDAPDDFRK